MTSKLLTLNDAGTTATVTEAEFSDIFSTLLSSNKALTGSYAWMQRLGLAIGGMAIQNKRLGGSYNPFA